MKATFLVVAIVILTFAMATKTEKDGTKAKKSGKSRGNPLDIPPYCTHVQEMYNYNVTAISNINRKTISVRKCARACAGTTDCYWWTTYFPKTTEELEFPHPYRKYGDYPNYGDCVMMNNKAGTPPLEDYPGFYSGDAKCK